MTDTSGVLVGNQDYSDNGGPPGQTFSVGGTGFYQLSGFTILGANNTGNVLVSQTMPLANPHVRAI